MLVKPGSSVNFCSIRFQPADASTPHRASGTSARRLPWAACLDRFAFSGTVGRRASSWFAAPPKGHRTTCITLGHLRGSHRRPHP